MANFIYGKAKQALLNGQFDISTDNLKVLLVNESYVPNENSDEFVSDILESYIEATSNNLSNITNNLGTIDADDLAISSYSGAPFNAVILFKATDNSETSRLLGYIDTATGIPFSGVNAIVDITIEWSNDSLKILSL